MENEEKQENKEEQTVPAEQASEETKTAQEQNSASEEPAKSEADSDKEDDVGDRVLENEGSTKKIKRQGGGKDFGRKPASAEGSEFVESVLSIKRVTKVTKGGKKLSFSALVVVGDTKGKVGYSLSKAGEVATAIRKALNKAKKSMIAVPLKGSTIPHEIIGECGGAEVLLKPASEGTGVIASGAVRAVCDGVGIHNILTKCHRSNNPINVVKATINGLSRLKTAQPKGE